MVDLGREEDGGVKEEFPLEVDQGRPLGGVVPPATWTSANAFAPCGPANCSGASRPRQPPPKAAYRQYGVPASKISPFGEPRHYVRDADLPVYRKLQQASGEQVMTLVSLRAYHAFSNRACGTGVQFPRPTDVGNPAKKSVAEVFYL